jgi:hypothetical protein
LEGDTASGFDTGLDGGSSFWVFSIVGSGTEVDFSAGFVDEQPVEKKAREINIKMFKTKPFEKYFISSPSISHHPCSY